MASFRPRIDVGTQQAADPLGSQACTVLAVIKPTIKPTSRTEAAICRASRRACIFPSTTKYRVGSEDMEIEVG